MARKKKNQQEQPEAVLVHAVAGDAAGPEEAGGQKQVSGPGGLIEGLYGLGAEVVLSLTGVEKVSYTIKFEGQDEALSLALPPGHYIICRVKEPPAKKPGLMPIPNPNK